MGDVPKVSIVTPNYNMAGYLEEAMLSVLDQDHPNIEYIVMDGGSTDESVQVIRKHEHRLAYWCSKRDGGTSEAINEGWRKSTGDFLWLLPSDDILPPNSISRAVDFLNQNPEIDFVYGDVHYIDARGNVIAREHFQEFDLVKCFSGIGLLGAKSRLPPVHGSLMRRRTFLDVGYLDPNIFRANDVDYLLRIALGHRMGYLAEVLGCFRIHEGSAAASEKADILAAREILRIYDKIFSRTDLAEPLIPIRSKALAGAYQFAGHRYLCWNHAREGLGFLLTAARLDHLRLFRWGFLRLLLPSLLGDRGCRISRKIYRRFFPRFTGKNFSDSLSGKTMDG